LFRVTTRRDKDRRVFGHVSNEIAVTERVEPEAGWMVGVKSGLMVGERG
jgi:hypothetical protein